MRLVVAWSASSLGRGQSLKPVDDSEPGGPPGNEAFGVGNRDCAKGAIIGLNPFAGIGAAVALGK